MTPKHVYKRNNKIPNSHFLPPPLGAEPSPDSTQFLCSCWEVSCSLWRSRGTRWVMLMAGGSDNPTWMREFPNTDFLFFLNNMYWCFSDYKVIHSLEENVGIREKCIKRKEINTGYCLTIRKDNQECGSFAFHTRTHARGISRNARRNPTVTLSFFQVPLDLLIGWFSLGPWISVWVGRVTAVDILGWYKVLLSL